MENNIIDNIWQRQDTGANPVTPQQLIKKATTQRRKQKIGVLVMSLTVVILTAYTVWQLPNHFNTFILGLFLMIGSLIIRILIEVASRNSKVTRLLELDGKMYLQYLKRFYKRRKRIHFIITPICFAVYVLGLIQLFPYFKAEFSKGFYIYLIVSAIVSLLVIGFLITNQIKKELDFLKSLQPDSF
ncbi:hypothetical protein [Nonlabens agnitus]|uniref:Uncharacterized protein n=1 Tax=Nonlabens agnitus TaxID=870484 RepID=A0A2S9WW90_9FLAO|nr:hypothetical protein [Nonlabens agnitus]PRP67711.1 hypothetical protein BST86_11710 [Nonlabens agnitus]